MLQQDYAATHPFYQKLRNFWTYHDCALSTQLLRSLGYVRDYDNIRGLVYELI